MICHVTVQTEDLQGTIDFYNWLLGLPVVQRFNIPDGEIAFLGEEETKFEIIFNKDYKRKGNAEGITVGFVVEGLQEKVHMLTSRGIKVSPIISPNPHARFAFFEDLNGIKIQLFEHI